MWVSVIEVMATITFSDGSKYTEKVGVVNNKGRGLFKEEMERMLLEQLQELPKQIICVKIK